MPASIHLGLITDLRPVHRPQPAIRWTRGEAINAGLVSRWVRPY
jgi:hypothetical protein